MIRDTSSKLGQTHGTKLRLVLVWRLIGSASGACFFKPILKLITKRSESKTTELITEDSRHSFRTALKAPVAEKNAKKNIIFSSEGLCVAVLADKQHIRNPRQKSSLVAQLVEYVLFWIVLHSLAIQHSRFDLVKQYTN